MGALRIVPIARCQLGARHQKFAGLALGHFFQPGRTDSGISSERSGGKIVTTSMIDSATTRLTDGLFDDDVQILSSPLRFRAEDLPSAEAALVARAVDSRRSEFATGRELARTLLRRMGCEVSELLRDDDRVPCWPERVVGSISHCDDLCVVAIAPSTDYRGIGLDVEPDEPVKEGVERIVCRPGERTWLESVPPLERPRRIKLIFSVKEAVYKAFYPELRTFWSFQDVETEIDLEAGSFKASLPEGTEVREIEGRVARREGWILSAVARRR